MINYAYEELFSENSIDYTIEVYSEGTTSEYYFTDEDMYSEDFEHYNPLCTENTLKYGACESGYVKFKVESYVGTLKGKKLVIWATPTGTTTPLQLGEFYVDSDELSDDRKSREIIAYDRLHEIINTDMLQWYSEVGLPKTIKEFRDSFFEYFGIEQVDVELCNDSMVVTETIIAESLSGLEVLKAILEANGCLGTMTNEGKFKYVILSDTVDKAYGTDYYQGTLVYEDYYVKPVDSLKLYSNKIDVTVGEILYTNQYIVEDNFLFYDKTEEDLEYFAQNLYDVISQTPAFRPLKVQVDGDPCVEVGDLISVENADGDTFLTYILEKTEKGLQALSDTFETEGTEYYEYDLNSGNSQIRRLWNNTLVLEREVETARCYVYAQRNASTFDIGTSTETQIISIPIAAIDDTIPVFVATIPLTMSLDGEITFRYYLDGLPISQHDDDTIYFTKGEQFATISTFFEMDGNSTKQFVVTAQAGYRESVERQQTAKINSLVEFTSTGTYVEQDVDDTPPGITIEAFKIRAMIFASGLASETPWDGRLLIVEESATFNLINISQFASATESLSIVPQSPTGGTFSDTAAAWNLGSLTFAALNDSASIVLHSDSVPIYTETGESLTDENNEGFYTEGD